MLAFGMLFFTLGVCIKNTESLLVGWGCGGGGGSDGCGGMPL
jgi:hypothetical protein